MNMVAFIVAATADGAFFWCSFQLLFVIERYCQISHENNMTSLFESFLHSALLFIIYSDGGNSTWLMEGI